MGNPEESFRRVEAAHESDMGVEEGCEEFTCPYCDTQYSLRYHEESGSDEFIDAAECPECGWPVPEEDNDFSCCEKVNNKEQNAPCPICNKIVHIARHVECQCVQLSCGHWVEEDFFEYAHAYSSMIHKLGLKRTGIHSSFIKKHVEAGIGQTFGMWVEDLERVLQSRFGISTGDALDEYMLRRYFEGGETPTDVADYLKEKRGLTELS